MPAIEIYRERFRPSAQLERPYVMLGFNVFAADTRRRGALPRDLDAAGVREPAQRPAVDAAAARARASRACSRARRGVLAQVLACSAIGGPETVRRALDAFVARTGADELMISAMIFDHAARLRSYEIAAQVA